MGSANLLDALRESRLLTDQQLARVAHRLGGGEPAGAVGSSLVADGTLTPYQLARVNDGRAKGLVLGQYRLLEELGSGGFGRVFRALHTVMGRVVALKVIAPDLVADARARNWFKREVQAATRLCHPNIVMAYDANEEDGVLFLVMEYVEGADLETVVRRQGPLPLSPAHEVMRQACLGLQHAHEQGMVHRDIKPANLLLPWGPARPATAPGGTPAVAAGAAPVVKIVDFGLARLSGGPTLNSVKTLNDNGFLGTPDYVSPEQARDATAADVRSDLYSLGCTFYFALSGRKPFTGSTPIEVLIKHLEEDPEPLEELRPEVPSGIAAVVRRLTAKDPGKRFQTPAEVVAELDFLAGRPGAFTIPAASPLAPVAPAASNPARRERAVNRESSPTRIVPELALGGSPRPTAGEAEAGEGAAVAVGTTPRSAFGSGTRPSPRPEPRGEPLDDHGELPLAEPEPADGDAPAAVPPGADRQLAARCRKWLAVVEGYVAEEDRPPVGEAEYRELHRGLLEACRALMAAAAGPRRELLRRLEGLVEPWLTPQSLASANPDALASLVLNCRAIRAELFGPEREWSLPGWVPFLLVLVLAGGGGLYLLDRVRSEPAVTVSAGAVWRLIQANPVASAAVAVAAVLLASIYLLVRPTRN